MKNPVPSDIARLAQIALVARMRYAHPMHPTPLQMAQRLEEVCEVLRRIPHAAKLEFFSTAKGGPLSGQTPLEALACGLVTSVRDAAHDFAKT